MNKFHIIACTVIVLLSFVLYGYSSNSITGNAICEPKNLTEEYNVTECHMKNLTYELISYGLNESKMCITGINGTVQCSMPEYICNITIKNTDDTGGYWSVSGRSYVWTYDHLIDDTVKEERKLDKQQFYLSPKYHRTSAWTVSYNNSNADCTFDVISLTQKEVCVNVTEYNNTEYCEYK